MATIKQVKFICFDDNDNIGYGVTETEAYASYAETGTESAEDLHWFEGTYIAVSVTIKKRTVSETYVAMK
jgi:hypothetical protein